MRVGWKAAISSTVAASGQMFLGIAFVPSSLSPALEYATHVFLHKRPQLVHVESGAKRLVLRFVEVTHTDLAKVTRVASKGRKSYVRLLYLLPRLASARSASLQHFPRFP